MATSVTTTFLNTKLFLLTGIAFILVVLHVLVIFAFNPNKAQPAIAGGTETPASLNALVSGCGGFFSWQTTSEQARLIPADQIDRANIIPETPMITPVYGYMSEENVPRFGFWDGSEDDLPSREQVMRHMHDGGKVIWYVTNMDPADKILLQELAEERQAEKIIALPWEGRSLPFDRQVAYATWGASQTCTFWSDVAFNEFEEFVATQNLARPDFTVVDVPSTGVMPALPGSNR